MRGNVGLERWVRPRRHFVKAIGRAGIDGRSCARRMRSSLASSRWLLSLPRERRNRGGVFQLDEGEAELGDGLERALGGAVGLAWGSAFPDVRLRQPRVEEVLRQ